MKFPIHELLIGRKVKYCVSGMARNYSGTNVILTAPEHIFAGVYWFYVKRGRGKIVVRTPDVDLIKDGKKIVFRRIPYDN